MLRRNSYTILTILTLAVVYVAGYATGYEGGARDMQEQVKTQLRASTAQTDTFDDCEGSNISSVSDCYGDE